MSLPEPREIEDLLPYATDAEKEELTKLLELKLSLASPLSYAQRVTPGTQDFPHIVFLDRYLVALTSYSLYPEGSLADLERPDLPPGISDPAVFIPDPVEIGSGRFEHPHTGEMCVYNLAISMPPQHGKSYIVSHHLTAWYVTKHPERPVAIVSYEETFATSWSYKAKTLVENHPEYGVLLDSSTKAKGNWLTTEGGGLISGGVGGPLTGRPIFLLVMDDLIKNSEEALSASHQTNTHNWWHSVAKTRNQSPRQFPGEEPKAGVRVLMHTRWAEDDLIGYTQRTEGDEWFYLNFPALAEKEGDPLGRQEGEALAPMLHSRDVLERIRDTGDPDDPGSGGAFWFEAMYQGHPTIEGAGIFAKPFHYFNITGDKIIFDDNYVCAVSDLRRFTTVDLAATQKTQSNFTVFMEFGQAPDGRLLVLDVFRDRLESPDHEDKLREFLRQRPKQMFTGIEDRTFGTALIQGLLRRGGIIVRPLQADKDKITRAIPAGQAIRNAKVWWPEKSSWKLAFEAEILPFPKATQDDQVDTLSYGVDIWSKLPMPHERKDDLDMSAEAKMRRFRKKQRRNQKAGLHPIIGRMR